MDNANPHNGVGPDHHTATFVDRVLMFTDIEGSSERWDRDAAEMRSLMRHHDTLISAVVTSHGGFVGARTGDGAIALFESAADATLAALAVQAEIGAGPADVGRDCAPLRVRVGLHRGVVEPRGGEHYGPPMHRAARVMATAHGGQIVASGVVADELAFGNTAINSCRMVDHGVHRLKGFHEPERLVELVPIGALADSKGLRVASTVGSLPSVDIETFVGRVDVVGDVLADLQPGHVVTLVGTGGVGKTRLALQVAWLAQPTMRDGAWFVDLAAASGPDRVLPLLADTLGIVDEASESLAVAVRQALHTRHMLVVFDNCEHVLDAVASVAQTAFSPAMAAAVLATSQRALDVARERCYQISPLAVDDDDSDVCTSEAGQMFVLAAQRADPSFHVGPGDGAAIGQIVRRLDGLPLALELAAARVRALTVRQIATELQTRFDLLRSRDHHERHRTMAAAIGWSVGLLADSDRATLFDLAVFNGDFDWEAAAEVSGGDRFDVADSLDELVRRSLLIRRESGLRMLVPLRLYCLDQLITSGREPTVRGRHARWVVATFGPAVDDPDPTVVAGRLDRLINAAEDVNSAHNWLVATDPAAAAKFTIGLGDAWVARARSGEAMARLRQCDVDVLSAADRVDLLGWLAAYGWTVGRHDEGEAAALRAIDIAAREGLGLPVFAVTRLAVRYAFSNRPELARQLVDDVVPMLLDDHPDASRHLGPLGVVVAVLGDMERGIMLADEGVARSRPVGALRLLTALANRILLEPTTDEVAIMTREVADIAAVVGRTAAQAHAAAALAHRCRRDGDIRGFLAGVGQFADLLLVDEPTSVVQLLQWVPTVTVDTLPRETAVLLAALESLAEQHNYQGTDKERARRSAMSVELQDLLGSAVFDGAWSEGSALNLAETVDRLHWLTAEFQPNP